MEKKTKNGIILELKMEQRGVEADCDRNEFALALKTWRLRHGLTQKQVGDRWGCSRYTIMRAELGRDITWEHIYKLFSKLSWELRQEAIEGGTL